MFLRQVLPPLDLVAFWDELKFVSFPLLVELSLLNCAAMGLDAHRRKMEMSGDLGVSSQDERPFPVYNMYFLFIACVRPNQSWD